MLGDLQVSKQSSAIIDYSLRFCKASETYQVHTWMLLLGILKHEQSTAAKTLHALGLTDLYGAWHEVLWALNVCDGLQPRSFVPEIGFADRAFRVLRQAVLYAEWGGRKKVQSEDLLMSLSAGGVLEGLFPDLDLSFNRVRQEVEKQAGGVYVLPDDGERSVALSSEDNFL